MFYKRNELLHERNAFDERKQTMNEVAVICDEETVFIFKAKCIPNNGDTITHGNSDYIVMSREFVFNAQNVLVHVLLIVKEIKSQ